MNIDRFPANDRIVSPTGYLTNLFFVWFRNVGDILNASTTQKISKNGDSEMVYTKMGDLVTFNLVVKTPTLGSNSFPLPYTSSATHTAPIINGSNAVISGQSITFDVSSIDNSPTVVVTGHYYATP